MKGLNNLYAMILKLFRKWYFKKVDRATMYYSIEGREPLLDHRILNLWLVLENLKYIRSKKYLLKEITINISHLK